MTAAPLTETAAPPESTVGIPCWTDVEELLDELAARHESFPTVGAHNARIGAYQRGRRLALESDTGLQWVAWDDLRACWETFERLGSIRREDVLDPGRCSAFVFALFAQVPGVTERNSGTRRLVLPR